MTIKEYLKNLERKGIISKKPNPLIPYTIALMFLLLIPLSKNLNPSLIAFIYALFIASSIFSFIHLIINKILIE